MTDIFISHPTPYNLKQEKFLLLLDETLSARGLNPVNLGRQNWNNKSPMQPISEMMKSCKAAIIIGMERYHSYIGYEKGNIEHIHSYMTSPWIHIEAGMAYQASLPLLILKEKKILREGIFDPNISEYYVYEFEIEKMQKKISNDLENMISTWNNSFNKKQ